MTRAVVLIDVRTASDRRHGSGFLIDPSGIILTNYHVIRDAWVARVKLASCDVYDHVSILAQDERRDIAVIRIAACGMPTVPLGNSDSVRIGTPVVLVGSPLGLSMKLMVVDGEFVSVGSTNFDMRSLKLNVAASLNIYHRDFALGMTRAFEGDLALSEPSFPDGRIGGCGRDR